MAIDDDESIQQAPEFREFCGGHTVLTDAFRGLTDEQGTCAIEILQRKDDVTEGGRGGNRAGKRSVGKRGKGGGQLNSKRGPPPLSQQSTTKPPGNEGKKGKKQKKRR